ncbi:hypothetical protein ACHAXR_002559, partial [Thalassiosira sp. AJA248-18]
THSQMSSPESTPEEPEISTSDQPDGDHTNKSSLPHPTTTTATNSSMSKIPRTLLLAALYASISGLLFGYQMGITGGALHSLQSSLDLTSAQSESIASLFFIGLMIASPFGGYACDRLGRRSSILYMDGLFLLAAFILAVAPNYNTILAGRFIAGCASGISLVAAVSYLTELASAEHHHSHRGALVSSVEASVSLGFLVSYLASYALTVYIDYEEGWRLLFGGGTGLLAFIQWMGMRKMPESPEWLAEQGFHDKAHEALRRITPRSSATWDDDGDQSIAGRMAEVEAEVSGRSEARVPLEYGEVNFFMLDDCPAISHYWRQAVIVAILAIAEQFCGHINIINYAPVIFAEVFYNYDQDEATENGAIASELLTTTIILAVVKFVITTFVLFEVDKLGRRFLLKAGAGIVTVSLLFLAIGFTVGLEDTKMTASGETELVHTNFQEGLVLVGCTGVVAGFALSYGPITWLVTSELSPSSIRGRMLGFYTVLTHGSAALVSYTFLSGQEKYGAAYPFWLYFCSSLASFAFIVAAVPETGGVTGGDGEDVESLLDDTLFWSKDNPIYRCFRPVVGLCPGGCKKNNSEQELGRIDDCFDDVEGAINGRRFSLS